MSESSWNKMSPERQIANVEVCFKEANRERLEEKVKRVQGPGNFTTETFNNWQSSR